MNEELLYANLDYQREKRRGIGEVIYGDGKTAEQITEIIKRLSAATDKPVFATRCCPDKFDFVKEQVPSAVYYQEARIIAVGQPKEAVGNIVVVCAGTSDLSVAEEAAVTCELLGNKVTRIYDVGVSGLHRLLAKNDELQKAKVIICVAGMEGALPSVVAGLVAVPVIAVPTSVGYGAAFGGVTALLAMLTSCSAGVSVVNIDNGFGAAYTAAVINKAICCK